MEKLQVSRRNKRYKAKRLFFTGKYTSRQIAAMVEVTEAAMSRWVKKYGWKDPATAGPISALAVFSIVSPGFIEHLEQNNPELLIDLKGEMSDYIKLSSSRITAEQRENLKTLFKQAEVNEFAGICLDQVDKLSFKNAKRLINQLNEYNQPPIEITIKQVNP